jgi:hypothetical protein
MKAAGIDLSFVDGFSGTLIITGTVSEVEASLQTILDYVDKQLALYSYEADVVGLLMSATEPYLLLLPNITCMVNKDVIGIVTKIDVPNANVSRATIGKD